MKRIGAIILMIIICLLSTSPSMAEQSISQSHMNIKSGALAAYTDENGFIYIPGNAEPVNRDEAGFLQSPAQAVLSIDPYRLLFFSSRDDGGCDLMQIDLESFEFSLLAENVRSACLVEESTLYYTLQSDPSVLMRMNLFNETEDSVYTASEPIDCLYLSAEGLTLQLANQAGILIYVEETDTFEHYDGEIFMQSLITDEYEIGLTSESDLYLKNIGSSVAEHIDSDVMAFAILENDVYYLAYTGSAIRLKHYNPQEMTWQVVLTPEISMENQLTVSEKTLFMLSSDHEIYTVNVEQCSLNLFKSYADLSAYQVPQGYALKSLEISGMSGLLNVYAVLEKESATPNFAFIEFESEADTQSNDKRILLDSIVLEGEKNAWEFLKPTEQYAPLAYGSRGDAVRAIQQPLLNLGYYDYAVDGIFGFRTQYAVRLLQTDLGLNVTGVADEDLQRIILSGTLNPYDPYIPLNRGNKGLRTEIMQERLRELGYLADMADGIYGSRTHKAVQLFQSENGLPISDSANRNTLIALYSDAASRCSSYIDLYEGDTGCRIQELNNRLKALYYLDASTGNAYTAETTAAIRKFQQTAGFADTGEATQAVQRALFSNTAPEAPFRISLKRGDKNSRVVDLQKRLKALNYFPGNVTGYYGNITQKAVSLFQTKVGLKSTGVASIKTQELLFANDAPIYVKPSIIGTPDILLDYYSHRENGVFLVSDDSSPNGQITFSWNTEGDVKSYNVRITDSDGNVYVDSDTFLTRTGVSVSTLNYNKTYTLEITAYPADGDVKHITSAAMSFSRIETPKNPDTGEIGQVNAPVLSVETVDHIQNGINYIKDGIVTFKWYAEGQVASYYIEIQNNNETVIDVNTTDEQVSVRSSNMKEGEIYTFLVYAIPVNGTIENAEMTSLQFALSETSLPDQSPENTPVPVVAPVLSFESVHEVIEDVSYVEGDEILLKWTSEGNVSGYYVEIHNSSKQIYADTTESQTCSIKSDNLQYGEIYTLYVTAIPENGSVESGISSTAKFALYRQKDSGIDSEPTATPVDQSSLPEDNSVSDISEISAPTLGFEPVMTVENGVVYVTGENIQLKWKSEGDINSYHMEIHNSIETIITNITTTEETFSISSEVIQPGELYTLSVTAIPENGSIENGKTSFLKFALYDESSTVFLETSSSEPTAVPTEIPAKALWDAPVDCSTDAELIYQIQNRLVDWGWLNKDEFSRGKLDEATVQSIISFQTNFNTNYGGALEIIDLDNPIISVDTLNVLMKQNDISYINPAA